MWEVTIRKKAIKNLKKLPIAIQERFKALALELRVLGPVQQGWLNYGKIQGTEDCHHCHIKKGHPIVFHKYTCTALSVKRLDNVRKSTLYSPFFL